MRARSITGTLCAVFLLGSCTHLSFEGSAEPAANFRSDAPIAPAARAMPLANWGTTAVYPTTPAPRAELARRHAPYTLDTGDRLRVFVYGEPNLSRLYPVDTEGNIAVPLIGYVRARARTTKDLARTITSRLATQYVRDPKVTVDIDQSRPFYILGEVKSAGQYPFAGGLTVEAAVAIAGGYTKRADGTLMRITRRVNGHTEEFEARPHVLVRPGDTIVVRERFF